MKPRLSDETADRGLAIHRDRHPVERQVLLPLEHHERRLPPWIVRDEHGREPSHAHHRAGEAHGVETPCPQEGRSREARDLPVEVSRGKPSQGDNLAEGGKNVAPGLEPLELGVGRGRKPDQLLEQQLHHILGDRDAGQVGDVLRRGDEQSVPLEKKRARVIGAEHLAPQA